MFQDIALKKNILTPRFRQENFSTYMEFWHDYTTSSDEQKAAIERAYFSLLESKEVFENEQESAQILELEHNLLPILARMELTGVCVDTIKLFSIGERMNIDIARLEQSIYDTIWEKFNINSSKQLQEILFEKLQIPVVKKNKTGLSVDNEVLEIIAEKYPVAKDILEYRSLQKLRWTYIEWLLKLVHPKTKRIHTSYRQTGTSTGRLSSDSPNLQNIPSGEGYADEIKSCFIPFSIDSVFLVADYSQVELRILASLSHDEHLMEAFQIGEDIHTRTARFMFGDEVEITGSMRRQAKAVNFWVIYGITGFGLSKMINVSPVEWNIYIEKFFAKYPRVRMYYDTLLENARKTGYVETFYWRRRYIEWLNDSNKMMRAAAEREAINMPIQWTAADIIKLAMIRLSKEFIEKKLQAKILMQVHDELVFEVPKSELDIVRPLVKEILETVVDFPVRLTVDIWVGENWKVAKK